MGSLARETHSVIPSVARDLLAGESFGDPSPALRGIGMTTRGTAVFRGSILIAMPAKDVTENMQASRTDGAVVVCRTLVSSFVKDPSRVAETAEMARHAQLLASKLQLPFADVQKVILAAWLSALEDRRDLIDPLVAQHGLRDILGLGEHPPGGENPNLGFQVLSLISGYQELKKEKPGIEKDIEAVLLH